MSSDDEDDGYRVNEFKRVISQDDDDSLDGGEGNSDSDDDMLFQKKKPRSKIRYPSISFSVHLFNQPCMYPSFGLFLPYINSLLWFVGVGGRGRPPATKIACFVDL